MSAISIYHRLVVVRYRTQAALARQALESQLEGGQTVVLHSVESKPAEPLALNSQPIGAGAGPLAPTSVPVSTPPIEAAVKSPDLASRNPVPAQPKTGSSPVPVAGLLSMPTAVDNPAAAAGKTANLPVPSILENSIMTLKQPGRAAAPTEGGEQSVASANAVKETNAPPEGSVGSLALKPAEGSGEPINPIQAESGNAEVIDVKAEPLPTKEESLRQIEEEAAKKKTEIDGFAENKQAELRAMRQSERLKFRDELRAVLESSGNRAGPEIDELSKRYGYDVDREKFVRARNVWRFTRKTLKEKVRFTRSLDLPESFILNFLSDEIYLQIGTREGPRNKNEGRIRAARMLLNFPLPVTDATASPAQSVSPNPGADSPKIQKRATSGRDAGARGR